MAKVTLKMLFLMLAIPLMLSVNSVTAAARPLDWINGEKHIASTKHWPEFKRKRWKIKRRKCRKAFFLSYKVRRKNVNKFLRSVAICMAAASATSPVPPAFAAMVLTCAKKSAHHLVLQSRKSCGRWK